MSRRIRRSELGELAAYSHFVIDDEQLDEFKTLVDFISEGIEMIDDLPSPATDNLQAIRDPGREPTEAEDPYNAIVRHCSVKASGAEGLLSGWRVGLKDSIAVAGVPLTAGSAVLRNFVPNTDSVVTRRILEAGGEIVAMLNMDCLAFSGGGDSSVYGPTLCPFDTTRTVGGSSGGSGAALHYQDIHVTLGCDQGGSIRVPAAWSGVIGLKPTYGLVPYAGIIGIDATIDHVGPLARSAADAARMLQVIAGKEPSDPRQPAEVPVVDYIKAVHEAPDELRGLRVGVVVEGFNEQTGVDAQTISATRAAIERLAELGAQPREVTVPEHLRAGGVTLSGFIEGVAALLEGGGNGFGWNGRYSPELARALVQGMKTYGDELSPHVKLALICATHLRRHYAGEFYARAYNLRRWLRAGYDRAFHDFDLLTMPTTPGLPHHYDPSLPTSAHVLRGWAVLANTGPLDFTGHPAITIPAAEADGLPVGLMVIARHFQDSRLLALAATYERHFGWLPESSHDPARDGRHGPDA